MFPRIVHVENPEFPPPLFETMSNVQIVLFVCFWVIVKSRGSPPFPIYGEVLSIFAQNSMQPDVLKKLEGSSKVAFCAYTVVWSALPDYPSWKEPLK